MNASEGIVAEPKRRRWWLWVPILLLVLAIAAWAAIKVTTPGKRAELGAGYVAHVVCSCRYVGNRDLASCRTDMEPGTEIVTIEDDEAKRAVTASVALLARRTATYDPEYGCALDKP
jgi:hypothetical protein